MEAIVKSNIEFLIDTLSEVDEVKTNLYLIRYLRLILSKGDYVFWEEASLELGRVIDTIGLNKYGQEVSALVKKLDVLLPCASILESSWFIHRTWKCAQSSERVKQSVLKIQGEHIAKAKNKLNNK
jgi:hypothetical protein